MNSLPKQIQSVLPELTVLGLFVSCWWLGANWLFFATLISLGIFFVLRYRQGQDDLARNELLQQLAAANDRLTRIGAQVPGVVYQFQRNPNGSTCFPYASEGIREVFGLSPNDVRQDATCLFDRIHAEDQAAVQTAIRDSQTRLTPWKQEFRVRCHGDELRWLYVHAMPCYLPSSATLWHGYLCDITERREAKLEAERTGARLEAVFNAATEVSIIATDLDGTIRLFNSGAEKLLGYTAEEVVGKHTPELIHLKSEVDAQARIYQAELGVEVAGLDVFVESARLGALAVREWTYVCKNGEHKTVRLQVTNVCNKAGQVEGLLGIAADVTELNQSQRELVVSAKFDKLTGLLNRHALLDVVDQRLHSDEPSERDLSVMFLDFDRFKIVNDSLGHDVGDQLLVAIGQRLSQFVGMSEQQDQHFQGDLAARFGGDEFILLLRGGTMQHGIDTYTACLQQVLAEPYVIGGVELRSTASIGVVSNHGQYSCANDLIRDADVAMYESKRAGRGSYLVFDTSMRDQVQRQLKLEADLGMAIENGQLSLAYQPIVSLESGEIYGVEALLRWQHPEDGWISPEEFIPIAEDSGLIQNICDWVVFEGCCQLIQWDTELGAAAPNSISLNLSPRQFANFEVAKRVAQVLHDTGVDPSRIVFELTESALMSDPDIAAKVLQRIKDLGSRIALDDFGIGNSSFASLHRFPVDILKFDRSFINGIQEERDLASLVHSIAVLARNLGICTVAEGVEVPEQFLAVRELGCDMAQGYLIAKPLTPDGFAEFAVGQNPAVPSGVGAIIFQNRWEDKIDLSV